MALPFIEYAITHHHILIPIIILSTYISEDATIISVIALVMDEKISGTIAFVSLLTGIASGDAILYWVGYLCQQRSKWVKKQLAKLATLNLKKLLSKNILLLILITRFIPGMRLPCYLFCGFYKISFPLFTLSIVCAAILWIIFIFFSMNAINDLTNSASIWKVAIAFIGGLIILRFIYKWFFTKKNRKH